MTKFYYFIIILFISASANAQYNWEVGGGIGLANYLGDIGGGAGEAKNSIADLKIGESKLSLSAFSRYRINRRFAIASFLNYGRISGEDANSENRGRRGRNLSFRNDLIEHYT